MNLKTQLLKEHSKANCLLIAHYVGNSKKRFSGLINLYLEGQYRLTQLAAWPISCCVERHPNLIQPHLNTLLNFLNRPGIHTAVKRNTVRLLQFIDVPKKFQGRVVEICFNFLKDKKEAVAVKAFSLTVLHNLSKKEPELLNELRMVMEDQLPYATAAIRARARKVLN